MESDTFKIDGETIHAYGCPCDRCRTIFLTIAAQTPDGEYFFTDEELLQIAIGVKART